MEVGYITIQGKKYPIRISYYVLKRLKEETGKELEDTNKDIHLYELMLYYALKSGAKYTDQPFTFEKQEMEEVLDYCFFEFTRMIPQFFAKPKEGVEEIKKKKNE